MIFLLLSVIEWFVLDVQLINYENTLFDYIKINKPY